MERGNRIVSAITQAVLRDGITSYVHSRAYVKVSYACKYHSGKKTTKQNFGEVSPVLTTPVLSAETRSSSEKNSWLLRLLLPITRLFAQPARLLSGTSPTHLAVLARHQRSTAVSCLHHKRPMMERTRTSKQSALGPHKVLQAAEGPHRRLNTGTLLSVHDIFRTFWKQEAAVSFSLL